MGLLFWDTSPSNKLNCWSLDFYFYFFPFLSKVSMFSFGIPQTKKCTQDILLSMRLGMPWMLILR